ncbi:MAG: lysophospholipase, partial [Gemmatimonadaceae bacterium]|nr:lysophospholipase [Gemmatimonadaceae bacterium]
SRLVAIASSWSRRLLWLVVLGACTACYRIRIDETYWLRARPGTGPDSAAAAAALPAGYRVVPLRIPVTAAIRLTGVAAVRPDAVTTVLFFGGDDFQVAQNGPAALRALTGAAPVNVVLLDYPGTGTSEGPATLVAVKAAALVAHDTIAARRDLAPTGVMVHGHSMGSFIAASVAEARPVRGLVLQSAATTPDEWRRQFFRPSLLKWWARPAWPFLRFTIDPTLAGEDNVARVRRFRGPLFVVVGAEDRTTSPAMSRTLAASAAPESPTRLAVLPGSGHDDVLTNPGFAAAYGAFVAVVAGTARQPGPRQP